MTREHSKIIMTLPLKLVIYIPVKLCWRSRRFSFVWVPWCPLAPRLAVTMTPLSSLTASNMKHA